MKEIQAHTYCTFVYTYTYITFLSRHKKLLMVISSEDWEYWIGQHGVRGNRHLLYTHLYMLVVNMEFLLKRKEKNSEISKGLCAKSSAVSQAQNTGVLLTFICSLGSHMHTELCCVTLCKHHPSLLGWSRIRRIWKKAGLSGRIRKAHPPTGSQCWDTR